MAPGTTSVGRRELTLCVAGDDRCQLSDCPKQASSSSSLTVMLFILPSLFFLLSLPVSVLSVSNSTNTKTDTCNPAHNGLATGTLQYNSDCNATTWCNNGICQNKGCRRDEFPLGYNTGESKGEKSIDPPPKCSVDEFCPDEGSACAPKIAVGQPCQFDRDGTSLPSNFLNLLSPFPDSCVGPDDFKDLRDTTGRGLNVNGSICLNFLCQYVFRVFFTRLPTSHLFRYANITAGSTCEIENTGYIAYGPSGEFVYVVSRYGRGQLTPNVLRFTVSPQR